MPFWYNEPGKDEKFATANVGQWDELNSAVEIEELTIRKDDDFYYIFGWTVKLTDVKKYGNNDWRFEPQLLQLRFARRNYEKYDRIKKSKTPVEQSNIEKLACKVMDGLDESLIYKGMMTLQDSNIVTMLINEVDTGGRPISPETYRGMITSYFYFVPLADAPQHLDVSAIKLPAKAFGQYSGGTKTQGEYEKLNDRVKFIIEQTKLAYPDAKVDNVQDIVNLLLTADGYASFWDIIGQIVKN